MTVCVAAISLTDRCVVGASDMTLSTADDAIAAADDLASKVIPLSSRWGVMYAGSPTHAADIVGRARASLDGSPRAEILAESISEMRRVLQAAYIQELNAQISIHILGRYGMAPKEFLKHGLEQFGDTEFALINKSIREFSLKTSLLVCGTEKEHGLPYIFTVHSPSGAITLNNPEGRAAIGNGAQMALGALGNRKMTHLGVRELLYRVCEAKFAAETAQGVGKGTLLTCWRNGFEHTARGVQTEELRAVYERARKEPVPYDAIEMINKAFAHTEPFADLSGM